MTGALLSVWRWIDKFYYRLTRLQYVDESGQNLFRVVVKPYRGETLITRDGVRLEKGDLYAKLHLHNFRIAQLLTERSKADGHGGIVEELLVLRQIRRSFPALARYLEGHPQGPEIHVLLGTTFLHRGAGRLGFDVQTLPGRLRPLLKSFFLKWILVCCHPQGWGRISEHRHHLVPKRVFISKEQFNQQHMRGRDHG
ncbi:MAG: hypothetical protein M0Z65_08765 [Firmicutes bacterium]|mgnify:CR=1 FL=1|nr:hypothetical protein [Bacillota bacterium]